MTLLARLTRLITFDLRRNPSPESTPKPKTDTRAAHYALEKVRADTHAKLREEVGL